jgi:hypothetical protein
VVFTNKPFNLLCSFCCFIGSCGRDCGVHLLFGHLLSDSIGQFEHFRSTATGAFSFLWTDGIGGEVIDTIVKAAIYQEGVKGQELLGLVSRSIREAKKRMNNKRGKVSQVVPVFPQCIGPFFDGPFRVIETGPYLKTMSVREGLAISYYKNGILFLRLFFALLDELTNGSV